MGNRLWDWSKFSPLAATYAAKTVRLSGDSLALFVATEGLTELFRWSDAGEVPSEVTADLIEDLVARAYAEIMTSAMVGTIQPIATDSVPDGMLECDGASYARVDYPELYAALAAPFIVDADNFVVPDLRGRVVIGAGAGAGLSTYAAGDTGGEEAHQLTTSELATHSHGVTDLGHSHAEGIAAPAVGAAITGVPVPSAVPAIGVTGVSPTGIAIQNAGADTAHENRQPYMALRWAIWAI